jgi:enoyl-[acyl-carrier protein] reductase II
MKKTPKTTQPISDRFFARGREFLGCQYPVLCGAMTWVSDPKLVAAVCNAGGFGCLAGGNTPVEILEKQIAETRKLTGKPFAVNLITIAPAYKAHMEMIQRVKLPYIIFAGSFPKEKEIIAAKATGAKVLCFASTLSIAERMHRYGADAIILEGSEAGGHIGHVSLVVLLQEVLFRYSDIPIFVAGGIATGRMAAHMLLMGASGVQLGTRFAVATESCAHAKFKDFFLRAEARDAVSTPQFDSRLPVVAVRALRNKGHDDFRKLQLDLVQQLDRGEIHREFAQMEVEKFWMGALRKAVIDGDIDRGSLMAGQSVGLVSKVQPVAEIIQELAAEIEQELRAVKQTLA